MGTRVGTLQCSFCQKAQREVQQLVTGQGVYICDQCIGACAELVLENDQTKMPLARAYLVVRALETLGKTGLTGTEVLERAKLIGEGTRIPATARELCEQLAGVFTDSVSSKLQNTQSEIQRINDEIAAIQNRCNTKVDALQRQLRSLKEEAVKLKELASAEKTTSEVVIP